MFSKKDTGLASWFAALANLILAVCRLIIH